MKPSQIWKKKKIKKENSYTMKQSATPSYLKKKKKKK
jgi:hypothetical protein